MDAKDHNVASTNITDALHV